MDDDEAGGSSAHHGKSPASANDHDCGNDAASSSSFVSDDAQTGVKGIEAISQTWTQSSLITAYLG